MAPGRTSHLHRLRDEERDAARAQEANQSSANATSAASTAPTALLPPTDSVALTTTTPEIPALDNPLSALLNATHALASANLSRAAANAAATAALTGLPATASPTGAQLLGWDLFNSSGNFSGGNANAAAGIICWEDECLARRWVVLSVFAAVLLPALLLYCFCDCISAGASVLARPLRT